MRKRLTLLRHAKSSWDDPNQGDFDRPLNKRGKRDAPAMGRLLKSRSYQPQIIIASSAKRAVSTATAVAAELDYPVENLCFTEGLYLASPSTLLDVVANLAPDHDDVLLIGHNPGMTELANAISDARLDNLPTCGIISVVCDAPDWLALNEVTGHSDWCLWPNQHLAADE